MLLKEFMENKSSIKLHITEETLYHILPTAVAYSDNNIAEKAKYINQNIINSLDGTRDVQTIIEIMRNTYSYLSLDSVGNYVCEYLINLHQCGLRIAIN